MVRSTRRFSETEWWIRSFRSEIDMQHFAGEGIVLNFLHQRQSLGPGIVLDGEVHQEILGDRMVDQVFHFLGVDFDVLRRHLPAINDGWDAPSGTESLGSGPPARS